MRRFVADAGRHVQDVGEGNRIPSVMGRVDVDVIDDLLAHHLVAILGGEAK